MKRVLVCFPSILLALASGCSSDDASNNKKADSGQACNISPNPKFISVSKNAGDPSCPDLTAAQLNEPDDAGDESCTTTKGDIGCKLLVSCSTTDPDGTTADADGLFTKNGANLSGDLAVTISLPDGTSVSCSYAVVLG